MLQREEAQLYPENNAIHVAVPLLVKINIDGGSAIVPINKDVEASLNIHSIIRPSMNESWELLSKASTTFEIVEIPRITILGIPISIDKQFTASIDSALPEINTAIEEQVSQLIDSRSIAEDLWALLANPLMLTEEPLKLWADIELGDIKHSDLIPSGPGKVENQFVVAGASKIISGKKPMETDAGSLPDLNKTRFSKEAKSRINMPLIIELSEFAQYLTDSIGVMSFKVPTYSDSLFITSYDVHSIGSLLEVSMPFTLAKTNGILLAQGRPVYDSKTGHITVEDLSLSSTSSNKVIDKLLPVLSKSRKFMQSLESQLSYDAAELASTLTLELTTQLRGQKFNDFAYMDGYIDEIIINDVFAVTDYLVINSSINGLIKVVISANSP